MSIANTMEGLQGRNDLFEHFGCKLNALLHIDNMGNPLLETATSVSHQDLAILPGLFVGEHRWKSHYVLIEAHYHRHLTPVSVLTKFLDQRLDLDLSQELLLVTCVLLFENDPDLESRLPAKKHNCLRRLCRTALYNDFFFE